MPTRSCTFLYEMGATGTTASTSSSKILSIGPRSEARKSVNIDLEKSLWRDSKGGGGMYGWLSDCRGCAVKCDGIGNIRCVAKEDSLKYCWKKGTHFDPCRNCVKSGVLLAGGLLLRLICPNSILLAWSKWLLDEDPLWKLEVNSARLSVLTFLTSAITCWLFWRRWVLDFVELLYFKCNKLRKLKGKKIKRECKGIWKFSSRRHDTYFCPVFSLALWSPTSYHIPPSILTNPPSGLALRILATIFDTMADLSSFVTAFSYSRIWDSIKDLKSWLPGWLKALWPRAQTTSFGPGANVSDKHLISSHSPGMVLSSTSIIWFMFANAYRFFRFVHKSLQQTITECNFWENGAVELFKFYGEAVNVGRPIRRLYEVAVPLCVCCVFGWCIRTFYSILVRSSLVTEERNKYIFGIFVSAGVQSLRVNCRPRHVTND